MCARRVGPPRVRPVLWCRISSWMLRFLWRQTRASRLSSCAPVSDVHRASPPWVPVGQSEQDCPDEQQLDLCPDRRVCCRYCKRTPQALFSGRSLRWGTGTVEAWGCLGLQLFSTGLYLVILKIWNNVWVWLQTAELSLHLNAICDVTDIILTLIPAKRSVCPSLSSGLW